MSSVLICLALAFIFGTIIGSFLNVAILRMNTGKGFGGRSICFSCGKQLGAMELIPVISFLFQGGRCTGCRERIAWQYPIVEVTTGFVFAAIAYMLLPLALSIVPLALHFIFYATLFCLLIVIAGYDLRHKIIPNRVVYPFILLSFLAPLFMGSTDHYFNSIWIDHLLAGIALGAPFALIWLLSHGRLMGLGDAKLALGMGFLLGISSGIAAIMLAFWIGAIVGVILLLLPRRARTMKSELPFAPFLVLGTALAFFYHIDLAVLSRLFIWS